MAVTLNPRAERLLARLPRVTVYSALELLLLLLIAIQCARLFWGLVTPLGPAGEWKALDQVPRTQASSTSLGGFDPFFRQAPGAPATPVAVVTSLDIRLYGITGNQATGGGSAIIGTADGVQRSYLVGEEIMPGVTLTGVSFDHVTITRNGAAEQLYLDQTPAAAAPAPAGEAPGMGQPQGQPQPQAAPMQVPTVVAPPAPAPPPPAQPRRVNS